MTRPLLRSLVGGSLRVRIDMGLPGWTGWRRRLVVDGPWKGPRCETGPRSRKTLIVAIRDGT